jgi:hypothetical protein
MWHCSVPKGALASTNTVMFVDVNIVAIRLAAQRTVIMNAYFLSHILTMTG